MKLWPSSEDHTPHETRFWVSSISGNIVPTEVVTETSETVEQTADRLLIVQSDEPRKKISSKYSRKRR